MSSAAAAEEPVMTLDEYMWNCKGVAYRDPSELPQYYINGPPKKEKHQVSKPIAQPRFTRAAADEVAGTRFEAACEVADSSNAPVEANDVCGSSECSEVDIVFAPPLNKDACLFSAIAMSRHKFKTDATGNKTPDIEWVKGEIKRGLDKIHSAAELRAYDLPIGHPSKEDEAAAVKRCKNSYLNSARYRLCRSGGDTEMFLFSRASNGHFEFLTVSGSASTRYICEPYLLAPEEDAPTPRHQIVLHHCILMQPGKGRQAAFYGPHWDLFVFKVGASWTSVWWNVHKESERGRNARIKALQEHPNVAQSRKWRNEQKAAVKQKTTPKQPPKKKQTKEVDITARNAMKASIEQSHLRLLAEKQLTAAAAAVIDEYATESD